MIESQSTLTTPSPFKELSVVVGSSRGNDAERATERALKNLYAKASLVTGCDRVEGISVVSVAMASSVHFNIVAIGTAVNTRERNHKQHGPKEH